MSYDNYSVIDCDGHIVESVPEMAEFMSTRIRQHATSPSRNRQGVFPSLDGMHFALHEENAVTRKRITASEYRPGSGEDWIAFLERDDLTVEERQAILADNAKRFFNL